jgi:hypothetical protein
MYQYRQPKSWDLIMGPEIHNWLGFVLTIFLCVVLALWLARGGHWSQKLLLWAVALRILGAFVRYEILFGVYGGWGDAASYYKTGLMLADDIWDSFISPFSLDFWTGTRGNWVGTFFVGRLSGLVLTLLGPSLRGEFVIFALLSFIGLYWIATAFRMVQPGSQAHGYATWMWLWPSLWFWPSSIGKESVILMAIGLVTLGRASKGASQWLLYGAGLCLAFCIRPHVAAVIGLGIMIAHVIGGGRRLNGWHFFEVCLVLAVGYYLITGAAASYGLGESDLEGVQEFVSYRAGQTVQGGSSIETVPLNPMGVPMAVINVWMRPFLWEAHNVTALIAAVEVVFLWILIFYRRHPLSRAIRYWRHHPILCFAFPLFAMYTLMIGFTFANLGLIARQRTPIFPFILMMVMAAPRRKGKRLRKSILSRPRGIPRRAALGQT